MATSATTDLQRRCDLLRSLHRPGDPFVLPNAWDLASARWLTAAGYRVVGTTSLGVAVAAGLPDGAGRTSNETFALAEWTAFVRESPTEAARILGVLERIAEDPPPETATILRESGNLEQPRSGRTGDALGQRGRL